MRLSPTFAACFVLAPTLVLAQARHVPTVDELLSIRSAGGARISPNGGAVAYLVTETDWKNDNFVSHLWIVNADGSDPRQLTRGEKSDGQPRWSPDGKWIAFTTSRVDNKAQIFVIRPDGGEAQQLTKNEGGVQSFAWSRDGRAIAFVANESSPAAKDRKNTFADFEVVRRDYTHAHLFTFDVASALQAPVEGTQRTRGAEYSVNDLAWSPDGTRIAFAAQLNPDLVQGGSSDIYVLSLADNGVRKIVGLQGPDGSPIWSPDGKQIAFSTSFERSPFFATNSRIAVVSADGGAPRSLTDTFDESIGPNFWTSSGIYFGASVKTGSHIFRLDPQSGRIARLSDPERAIVFGYSLSADGSRVAFGIASPTSLPEIAVSPTASWAPRVVTSMTSQTDSLIVARREVVSWK